MGFPPNFLQILATSLYWYMYCTQYVRFHSHIMRVIKIYRLGCFRVVKFRKVDLALGIRGINTINTELNCGTPTGDQAL